jgi:hypothetical protein
MHTNRPTVTHNTTEHMAVLWWHNLQLHTRLQHMIHSTTTLKIVPYCTVKLQNHSPTGTQNNTAQYTVPHSHSVELHPRELQSDKHYNCTQYRINCREYSCVRNQPTEKQSKTSHLTAPQLHNVKLHTRQSHR